MKQFRIVDLLLAIAFVGAGMAFIRVSWAGWHDKPGLVFATIPIRLFWLPAPILITSGLFAPFQRKAIGSCVGVFFAIAVVILFPIIFPERGHINWSTLVVASIVCTLIAGLIVYRQED